MTAADPRDGLLAFADRVERLAFSMPAPNPYTPQFAELAIAARSLAHARPEAVGVPLLDAIEQYAAAVEQDVRSTLRFTSYAAKRAAKQKRKDKQKAMRTALTAAITPERAP